MPAQQQVSLREDPVEQRRLRRALTSTDGSKRERARRVRPDAQGAGEVVDPEQAAEQAGLRYVSDERQGLRRKKSGKGFSYRGHIQATGRDARGRKQYRYHPRFREVRESTKYEHVVAFANALPAIRSKVREHMALRGLPREKILATVVHLLETTLIRVGNDDYARQNNSYGLTTLKNRHVEVNGSDVRFRFTGKGGKQWSLRIRDRRIARIIRACQELPGQELLQYVDEEGSQQDVTSDHVNAYLREITGQDITAKDFRTWAGTVLAAIALNEMREFDSQAQAKKNVRAAIERVAARLGNTPTICRKCYVHPEVLSAYLDRRLVLKIKSQVESELRGELAGLQPEEVSVLSLLRAGLKQAVNGEAARQGPAGVVRRGNGRVHAAS
jgi:DNA topoisomerase-1